MFEKLYARLNSAKHELHMAYTFALAARNIANKKVTETNLQNKILKLEDAKS